jgi:hypothetical protein
MKRMTRKGVVITGAVTALAVVGAGAAFAYWTSSGTSTGEAAAGTTASVTIAQDVTPPITGLYPGGPAQDVAIDITNPNDAAVTLANLTTTVTGTSNAGCTAADFQVTDAWTTTAIAGGATVNYPAVATIAMLNTGSDQDACKGVTIDLAFSAS